MNVNCIRTTFLCILLSLATSTVTAQVRTEYRAFWVDTFNTNLNNHNDVLTVVNNAKAAGRLYTVVATLTDMAGNTTTISTTILVPHDLRN